MSRKIGAAAHEADRAIVRLAIAVSRVSAKCGPITDDSIVDAEITTRKRSGVPMEDWIFGLTSIINDLTARLDHLEAGIEL